MYSKLIQSSIERMANKSILDDLSIETNRLEAIEWLNSLTHEFEEIKGLKFSIAYKNDKAFLLFRFEDADSEVCKGGIEIENSLEETLSRITLLIHRGQVAVDYLNSKIEELRATYGIVLDISYKWGFSEHAHLVNWDYSTIVVRLSKRAIESLTDISDEDKMHKYIDDMVKDYHWPDNLLEYIQKFNEQVVNNKLHIELKYNSIVDTLKDNMIDISDIKNTIKNNIDKNNGMQRFKSIYILNELGIFIAIVIWQVDYKERDISVSILDDKVMDIENLRFVSDHSLYSRIEQRILNEAEELATWFKG